MTTDDVDTERLEKTTQRIPGQGAAGDRIIADRYLLRGELGRGGMGVVWRGEDRVIGRPVAVKEMRLAENVGAAERAEFEERILREARIAGRLNDPAVVTVFDVVHDNGSVYIVMELVDAPTLSQLIRTAGPLAPAFVAEIGRQVLTALEAAHAAGVVHRDVKPSNIMIAPSGRAKLTDFGIAHAADDPTLTKTGMVVGSPAYLAPERLSGREATPASDIWSLGAVLFFAVEGKPAFERDTTAATLSAVVNEVPFLTRAHGPLAAAISGMLAVTPEGRLTGAQIRTLLTAAASADGTRVLQADPQTMAMPADQQTMAMPAGQPPASLEAQLGLPVAPAPVPGRGRLRVGLSMAAVLAIALTGFAGYTSGHSSGAKSGESKGRHEQLTADARPADSVEVFTLGGPNSDLGDFSFSYQNCAAGPMPLSGKLNYNLVDCKNTPDLELYYKSSLVNSSFSGFAANGGTNAPYPGVDELKALGRQLCWADRKLEPNADPAGSSYQYAALIPSEDLWTGANLPTNGRADQEVLCVMWNPGKQLPADG